MQSEDGDWCLKNDILGITTGNLKGFLMLMLQLIINSYDIYLSRKIQGDKTGVDFFGTEPLNSLSK